MKRTKGWATYGGILLMGLAVFAAVSAWAENDEKPGTGVACVRLIRGDAILMRDDAGGQTEAKINMPLVRGDKVCAGVDSQVEIQLDLSNTIRLAAGSQVRIADLTSTQIQLQITKGLVTYTVLKTNERQIELDTPNMAVHPVNEGTYRIQVISPTETQLIVRQGEADVTTPQGTVSVNEGCFIMVRGADDPEYLIVQAPDPDDWDKWNSERDNGNQKPKSTQYARRERSAAEFLNPNDQWVQGPAYGEWCLTPYVNAGWIPYVSDYPRGTSPDWPWP